MDSSAGSLLEQLEERTLHALRTSPVRFGDVILYRAGAPAIFGALATPAVAVGLGFGVPSLGALLVISVVGAMQAGIVALFIPAFAADRVQAFAMSKIVSTGGMIPIVAYFLGEPPASIPRAGCSRPGGSRSRARLGGRTCSPARLAGQQCSRGSRAGPGGR